MTSEFEIVPGEPSAVLPAQVSGNPRRDDGTSGPRALMLAVLEDAVRCLAQGRRRGKARARRLAAEAEAWVRCDRRAWPFSFVNVCEVLGFDADAMRARLLTDWGDTAHGGRTRVRVRFRSPMRSRMATLAPQRPGSARGPVGKRTTGRAGKRHQS